MARPRCPTIGARAQGDRKVGTVREGVFPKRRQPRPRPDRYRDFRRKPEPRCSLRARPHRTQAGAGSFAAERSLSGGSAEAEQDWQLGLGSPKREAASLFRGAVSNLWSRSAKRSSGTRTTLAASSPRGPRQSETTPYKEP